MASRSVQPFLQGSWSLQTDSLTARQSDKPLYSVCSKSPHLVSAAMWPNNWHWYIFHTLQQGNYWQNTAPSEHTPTGGSIKSVLPMASHFEYVPYRLCLADYRQIWRRPHNWKHCTWPTALSSQDNWAMATINMSKNMWFGHVVFEICDRTDIQRDRQICIDRHTDKLIAILHTPTRSEVISN